MAKMHEEPTTNLDDLEAVYRTMERLASVAVPGDCYINDAVDAIKNYHDYPVGWIWYDGENERWCFVAHRDGVTA